MFEVHCLFVGGPGTDAWVSVPIPGKEAVGKRFIWIDHACQKKKWFLFLFLSVCPSHPGLPNTCLWWNNTNRIARFLGINCCLTVPAKHCKVIWFFLFVFFSCSPPHIQRASAASPGGTIPGGRPPPGSLSCRDLKVSWVCQNWYESRVGVSHCPPVSCYPRTEQGDTTESQVSLSVMVGGTMYWHVLKYCPVVTLLSVGLDRG